MKAKNMLLGPLSNKSPKVLEEIFKDIMTAAKIIYTAKWKVNVFSRLEEWENKLAEYAVMVKSTAYLRNR